MENTRTPNIEDFSAEAANATSRMATEAANATSRAVDTVSEMTESAGKNVRRIARDAADHAQRTADYFRENGVQKISEDVMDYAKANPVQALVGAAVVGFLFGRLMSSRQ